MHYHWQNTESLIKDVEFYAPHKKEEALIYAPAGVEPEKLQAIADKIRILGFVAEPDMEGENYVLRVKKFHKPAELLNVLEKEGLISGEHTTQKTNFDNEDAHKWTPQKWTGLLYMMGDTVLIASGAMRNGWLNDKSFFKAFEGPGKKDIHASAMWLTAGSLLFFLGSKDPDKQSEYAYHDLAESMKKAGFTLNAEDETTLKALAEHKDGILPKLERLVRENPLIINSALQAYGGFNNFNAGRDQDNPFKTLGGASTFLGHTTALLTDETPKAEQLQKQAERDKNEKDDRSLLEKIDDWRHEKKFWIAGKGSVVASVLRICSGFFEVRDNKAKLDGYAAKEATFLSKPEWNAVKDITLKDFAQGITNEDSRLLAKQELSQKFVNEASSLWKGHYNDQNATHAAKIEWFINCTKAVANQLYSMAGGSVNADIKKLGVLDEICNSVARMASHEPDPELRTVLMSSTATMLAEQKGIDNSEAEILGLINKHLIALQNNPFEKHAPHVVVAQGSEQQHAPLPEAAALIPAPHITDVAAHIPPQPQVATPAHVA